MNIPNNIVMILLYNFVDKEFDINNNDAMESNETEIDD